MNNLTPCKPIILGCSGTTLTQEEANFFTATNPFGFILFQRNVKSPEQVKDLVHSLRDTIGRDDIPVFIDKEGGRVTRLKPPYWPSLPSMRVLGEIYEKNPETGLEAIHLHSLITAYRLIDLGINGNCAPVLDLMIEGANDVIGDRAFSRDPKHVIECARVVMNTFMSCGVFPIVKHMPGHGRVDVDPHFKLPFVDTDLETLNSEDFVPFKALSDAPMAMNCHVVFRALDPDNPTSLSPKVHKDIFRGLLNYKGLIVSDDLAMKALSAPLAQRGKDALEAGADIIFYCSGELDEMQEICSTLPNISESATVRWGNAQAQVSNAAHNVERDLSSIEDQFKYYLG